MAINESAQTPQEVAAQCEAFKKTYQALVDEVGKVIVGHREVVDAVLMSFFAGGNVLLEGVPGQRLRSMPDELQRQKSVPEDSETGSSTQALAPCIGRQGLS